MKALFKQSFSRNYTRELGFDFTFGFNQFGANGQITGTFDFENKKIGHTEEWKFVFHSKALTDNQQNNIKYQIQKELRKDVDYKLQTERALLINRK